ncbi:MAG: MASE1 domain-containing protein [Acidimicrobiales bacterium]
MAVGYGVLSRLGMALVDSSTGVAAMWPASGFALGMFLLSTRRRWPALAAAIFVSNLVVQVLTRGSLGLAAVLGLADAAEPMLMAAVIGRATGPNYLGSKPMRRAWALLGATGGANAVTAALAAGAIAAMTGASFGGAWLSWFLADGVGILTLTPLMTSAMQRRRPPRRGNRRRAIECGAVLVAVAVLGAGIFLGDPRAGWVGLNYSFAMFPVLLWAAMRSGDRTLATALSLVGVLGALGTAQHLGPFGHAGETGESAILALQLFLIVAAAVSLVVHASVGERSLVEDGLSEERKRFASVLRAATEYSIIAADADGVITLFNGGAERMLGLPAEGVIGTASLTDFHDPAEVESRAIELGVPADFHVFVPGTWEGRSDTREWTYVRGDGRRVPVLLTVTATRAENGTPSGYIAIATNISESKLAQRQLFEALATERALVERLEDLDQAKSDFVATVSHELRTPLTSILGFIELLTDHAKSSWPEEQQRMLKLVDRNASRLQVLVEDLLAIARMDSDTDELHLDAIDLTKLTAAAAAAVEPLAEARLLTVDVRADADLPLLNGDHALLERVVLNLLSNAIKFTPSGGDVGVNISRGSGSTIEVAVWDTGIGISEADQVRMFERFFRTSAARQVAAQGSGLGLAIVADIVERHEGTISVESGEGLGSTFTVTLPMAGPRSRDLVTAGGTSTQRRSD